MSKKKQLRPSASEQFDLYYANLYQERWPQLKAALLAEKNYTNLRAFLLGDYYLDEGSVWIAQALKILPGSKVLDLCAAPGGKSLVLAQQLQGSGLLIANDRSTDRFFRLKKTIDLLPAELKAVVQLTKFDATRYSIITKYRNFFDAILLDAPCSSEEHLMKNPEYLDKWSLHRAKNLAITQHAMLCQALELCKPNGHILYSTCAINQLENDGVITHFLKKRGHLCKIIKNHSIKLTEETAKGYQLLPDRASLRGPLYYTIIKKVTLN